MQLLYGYLRNYWALVAIALTLATINQVFSLLDPLIFRYVIDQYATRFQEYTTGEFFRRQPAAGRRDGRRICLTRGEELPGLLHQCHHAASGRPVCTPMASDTHLSSPIQSSKISAAAKRSASSRRSAGRREVDLGLH